jgi:integrase/recombinase XerD
MYTSLLLEKAQLPHSPFREHLKDYLEHLETRSYSHDTLKNKTFWLGGFYKWIYERGIVDPVEVNRLVLEGYQRYLYHFRKKGNVPLAVRSQHQQLSVIKVFFSFLCKKRVLLHNPAGELDMPRVGRPLPKDILSPTEAEQILSVPDVETPLGLRDRALLELLYSSGLRRTEAASITLYDLHLERRSLHVHGKGDVERYVPIGKRALYWLEKYLDESRPLLLRGGFYQEVFLTGRSKNFTKYSLSNTVLKLLKASGVGKMGGCHLFRHTMATLMLENGASLRDIQMILGHASLTTTQRYTHLSTKHLTRVHDSTHPANDM